MVLQISPDVLAAFVQRNLLESTDLLCLEGFDSLDDGGLQTAGDKELETKKIMFRDDVNQSFKEVDPSLLVGSSPTPNCSWLCEGENLMGVLLEGADPFRAEEAEGLEEARKNVINNRGNIAGIPASRLWTLEEFKEVEA